jgi:hypothetical protein
MKTHNPVMNAHDQPFLIHPPLLQSEQKILFQDKVLFDFKTAANEIQMTFIDPEWEILTPRLENSRIRFDLKDPDHFTRSLFFNRILVRLKNILLEINLHNPSSVSLERQAHDLLIRFDSGDPVRAEIKTADDPGICFGERTGDTLPAYFAGIGFECDYRYPLRDFQYCRLVDDIEGLPVYVILRNWHESDDPLRADPRKTGDEESFFKILRINRIPCIPEYSFTGKPHEKFQIRYRDDRPILKESLSFLDICHPEGVRQAEDSVEKILEKGAAGLYVHDPLLPGLSGDGQPVIRNQHEIHNYREKIMDMLKLQEQILSRYRKSRFNACYLTRFKLPEQKGLIKIDPYDYTILFFEIYFHLYFQYSGEFSLCLSREHFDQLTVTEFMHFLLGGMTAKAVIFDIRILLDNTARNLKKIKSILSGWTKQRLSLRLFYSNLRTLHQDNQTLFRHKNEIAGLISGRSLYVAIPRHSFFDERISVPEGSWYYPETDSFIPGNTSLILRMKNGFFPYFIHKNSVIPVIDPDFNRNLLLPDKITFYIWTEVSCSHTILEDTQTDSEVIRHDIQIEMNPDHLTLQYQSSHWLKDRLIEFIVIHEKISGFKRMENASGISVFHRTSHIRFLIRNPQEPVTLILHKESAGPL